MFVKVFLDFARKSVKIVSMLKLNTKRILEEKKRLGLTYAQLGQRCKPQFKSAQAMQAAILEGKTFRTVQRIAKGLNMAARDLIL